jgi:hypothetical protein
MRAAEEDADVLFGMQVGHPPEDLIEVGPTVVRWRAKASHGVAVSEHGGV